MTLTNSERNARSRQRLRELVARLDDETLRRQTDAEWTIGAHDRTFILERWEHREEHLDEIERFLGN